MTTPVDANGNVPVDIENSSGAPADVAIVSPLSVSGNVKVDIAETTVVQPVSFASPTGAPNFATSQVAVAATATSIIAARSARRSLIITNNSVIPIFIGVSGVSVTTGILLPGIIGAFIVIDTTAAVFGISSSGTNTVTVGEVFN